MEATLLSLTPGQVAELNDKYPRLGGIWRRFKANIERPIAFVLVLNTAAHTIGATVAGAQFTEAFGEKGIWVFSLLFTFVMLQFTEILPKTLGVRFNDRLAKLFAVPLAWGVRFTWPALQVMHFANRPFEGGRARNKAQPTPTVDELAAMAGLARLSKEIDAHQERIIKGASRLSRMKVRQVMLPVEQVAFISAAAGIADAMVAAHEDAHTRYPVCEANDPNRIVGYVNFKELVYFMRTNPNEPTLRGIIRPVHFVGPQESAAALLRTFVDQHVHIAMVRDSAGKTLGLVTFEDLVEELTGDLQDEFDHLPRQFHALSGGVWMVGGGMPVPQLAALLDARLPETTEVLSAWLSKELKKVPKVGDVVTTGALQFTVRRVRRGKIFEVSVMRQSKPAAAGQG
jgi:CBS domain containing-hemolysin-like protein